MAAFVGEAPRNVYESYTHTVGWPEKSDSPPSHYELPVWNSWAQFYVDINQTSFLDYATQLAEAGIKAHAVQLDDRWENVYGDLEFLPSTFPGINICWTFVLISSSC